MRKAVLRQRRRCDLDSDNMDVAVAHAALRHHAVGEGDDVFVGSAQGKGEMAQTGPNTLRNSCIACWLRQGVTLAEVLRRCGLKDPGVLRLQRHVNPEAVL